MSDEGNSKSSNKTMNNSHHHAAAFAPLGEDNNDDDDDDEPQQPLLTTFSIFGAFERYEKTAIVCLVLWVATACCVLTLIDPELGTMLFGCSAAVFLIYYARTTDGCLTMQTIRVITRRGSSFLVSFSSSTMAKTCCRLTIITAPCLVLLIELNSEGGSNNFVLNVMVLVLHLTYSALVLHGVRRLKAMSTALLVSHDDEGGIPGDNNENETLFQRSEMLLSCALAFLGFVLPLLFVDVYVVRRRRYDDSVLLEIASWYLMALISFALIYYLLVKFLVASHHRGPPHRCRTMIAATVETTTYHDDAEAKNNAHVISHEESLDGPLLVKDDDNSSRPPPTSQYTLLVV